MRFTCDQDLAKQLSEELKQYPFSEHGMPLNLQVTSEKTRLNATRGAHVEGVDTDGAVVFSATPLIPQTRHVILVGLSKMTEVERIRTATVFPMHEIISEGLHNVCDAVMAKTREYTTVTLVVDMSVVDEPGGMTVRDLLYFLQRLAHTKKITAAEVMRINDVKVAAKIISETAALLLLNSNESFK